MNEQESKPAADGEPNALLPDPVQEIPGRTGGIDAADGSAALQTELERVGLERDKYRDEMLRAMAELDNVRKRAARDVEAAHKFGAERLVEALIPVKDSLDLGYEASKNTSDISGILEGIELTLKMFDVALEKIGVQVIEPLGAKFDPAFHQAMMLEATRTAEPGTVLRVMQKGYLLNERLIRPALVVVARASE